MTYFKQMYKQYLRTLEIVSLGSWKEKGASQSRRHTGMKEQLEQWKQQRHVLCPPGLEPLHEELEMGIKVHKIGTQNYTWVELWSKIYIIL